MKTTFSFYRVAVIGCGFIGVKYIQTFFSIPNITLQTICDSNLALLTGLKEQFNVKKTETNWQKVVAADDIDIVCICVPTNMHYTIASEAIKYRKSIICEKPLGHSFRESLLLSKMAHDNCINAICSYSLIFAPAIQYIKKIIDSGILGEAVLFRGSYDNDRLVNPHAPFEWRMKRSFSLGGAICDLGINIIAISQYLLGDIKKVCGTSRIIQESRTDSKGVLQLVENEDILQFMSLYSNNALGYIASNRVSPGSKQDMRFEIQFTQGAIRYSLERMNEICLFKNGDLGFSRVISDGKNWFNTGYEDLRRLCILSFVDSINNRISNDVDFSFAAKIDGIIFSVLNSIQAFNWTDVVPSDTPATELSF